MRDARLVSKRFEIKDSFKIEVAKANGVYADALKRAYELEPLEIINIIKESGLRGKGGGGASAGDKWELMPLESDKPSFLAVNCDESEPGTFKDRQIISKDPHLLIEGILITCRAIKAKHAYIYIRGEYKQFQDILQNAIDEA
ncbi:MAG: NADH-quinone oxidoreductase subunit F, partial [Thiovulaceae bacterium]|nr:NADH-quinone oxidoreductase subunit F [Sulfurimonadaceae bacterium]